PPEVRLRTRWLLYTGAWSAAFLSCTFIPMLLRGKIPDRYDILGWLVYWWGFPAGLIEWFPTKPDNILLIVGVWFAYLVHGVFTLRSRTRVRSYVLLAILVIVLVFNVIGCHRVHVGPRVL